MHLQWASLETSLCTSTIFAAGTEEEPTKLAKGLQSWADGKPVGSPFEHPMQLTVLVKGSRALLDD